MEGSRRALQPIRTPTAGMSALKGGAARRKGLQIDRKALVAVWRSAQGMYRL
jgi:hypothetical protein